MQFGQSASSYALNLPELLHEISHYLTVGEIASSLLVCRAWHSSLHTLVVRDVFVDYGHDSLPPIYILRNYSSRIQSIIIVGRPRRREIEYFNLRNCTAMRRFEWKSNEHEDTSTKPQWSSMIDFVTANRPTLRNITIDYRDPGWPHFWEVFARDLNSSLRSLSIKNTRITKDYALYLWKIFGSLEKLELSDWRGVIQYLIPICKDSNAAGKALHIKLDIEPLQEQDIEFADTKYQSSEQQRSANSAEQHNFKESLLFPRMKSLELTRKIDAGDWLVLMEQCPRLESLQGYNLFNMTPIIYHRVCEIFSSETLWENLNSINLFGITRTDERLAKMILLLNRYYPHPDQYPIVSERPKRLLKALYAQYDSFGSASMCALRYHHHVESLEVFSLESSGTRSIHILTILTSCPCLKSITAPAIHATDVVAAKNCPWICLGLQIWDVNITFAPEYNVPPPSLGLPTFTTSEAIDKPTIAEMQEACIEQLGRLYQLKSLKTTKSLYPITETFSLVLSKGLERLAGLTQLEEVKLGGLTPQDEDLGWMEAHWRSLKRVDYGCRQLFTFFKTN